MVPIIFFVRSSIVTSAALAGLILILSAQPSSAAQAKPQAPETSDAESSATVEKYTATAVNLAQGDGETVTILVSRWSSGKEREALVAALTEKGDAGLQTALEAADGLGYLWTDESIGYAIRYAYRATLPDKTERVLIATDRRLGAWTRGYLWKTSQDNAPDYPFTLVELRLRGRRTGEGKMSLASKVIVDAEAKTIALENYAGSPVLLKGVRGETVPNGATN